MTVADSGPAFSVQEIPFSHRGSWFNVSSVVGPHTYADDLHLVSHQNGLHPILCFAPSAGGAHVTATPSVLTWRHATGGAVDALADWIEAGGWTGVAGVFLGYALAYTWGLRARLLRFP